ncbi:hypothetical protein AB0N62_43190 [Streptomyces sp. NPDC093982]
MPDAAKATDDELYNWSKRYGFSVYQDEALGTNGAGPYYRQAATQLG